MKKTLAILLIAILAAGSMFAALTGDASVTFGAPLDGSTPKFDNTTSTKVTVVLEESSAEKVGEGDIYAEVKATLTVKSAEITADVDDLEFKADLDVAKANITNGEWAIGILGMPGAADYAAEIDLVDGKSVSNIKAKMTTVDGLTLSNKGYTVGVGFDGAAYAVSVETPEYTLAEGATAQAYVGLDKEDVSVSAKAAYAIEDIKVTAAADFTSDFKFASKAAEGIVKVDAAPADVSVYYATGLQQLDVQAVGTVSDYTLTAKAYDLLNTQDLSVTTKIPVDSLTFDVMAGYVIATDVLKASVATEYTYDIYAIKASVAYEDGTIKPAISASTSKLVDGAELSLGWADAAYSKVANNGKVEAKCKIAF